VDVLVLTAFRKHDADGSGDISCRELHAVLKDLGVDVDGEYATRVLSKYDADQNGTLSLAELDLLFKDALYANGLSVPPPSDVDPMVLAAFRKHDTDGSGDVSTAELHVMHVGRDSKQCFDRQYAPESSRVRIVCPQAQGDGRRPRHAVRHEGPRRA
jgi:hypothetical protein